MFDKVKLADSDYRCLEVSSHEKVLWNRVCIHNTSFYTKLIKRAPKGRVLNYTRQERLRKDKHSNLLGTFASYEENEVL